MTLQGGPAHYLPNWLATLSRCLLPTTTIRIKCTHLLSPVTIVFGLLDPKNECTTVLQNVKKYSSSDTIISQNVENFGITGLRT